MEDIVIISNLKVNGLYGNYNYSVNFNKDITLLYWTNGCGKTTILNIITSIITGSIYKLFSYKFESIILTYIDEKENNSTNQIVLLRKDEDEIEISFRSNTSLIKKLQIPEDRRRRIDFYDEIYFDEYSVLKRIRTEFNFVYLALNRATALSNSDDFYYMRHRRFYVEEDSIVEPDRVDPEIRYVENLICKQYMNATAVVNKINNEFRDSILKSALDVNIQTDLDKFLSSTSISTLKQTDVGKIKNSYMKILSDLQLVSGEERKQYAIFFEDYSSLIKGIENQLELKDMFALFTAFNEMKKIQGIVDIAAEAEKQKAKVMSPIELYLNTVNDFISTSDFEKKIEINIDGIIYFTTKDSEKALSIQYLSSGERQLIVFFANLIFGVKDTTSGIFVVDEPELSLHLSWQKVFVKKALEVNKNVQFIFATHAPEIIGNYRDKSKKLQRKDAV